MSIINKMHQDFQQVQQEQPILAYMPEKKGKQKALLLLLIALLLASSLGLSYLIFTQEQAAKETEIQVIKSGVSLVSPAKAATTGLLEESSVETVTAQPVQQKISATNELKTVKAQVKAKKQKKTSSNQDNVKAAAVAPKAVSGKTVSAKKTSSKTSSSVKNQDNGKKHLEIKTAQLSKAQLAQIHLKEADKAQAKGGFELAAKKRLQALTLLPNLNDLRKSLALYYYGQGDVDKASRLLKKGALVSPDYPDFNLMLSRIALKAGDQQKAYLYLEQHPPKVEGNLDYYVSHAVLAQKFKKYEQSEQLYTSLLSQRPNNGRWRMSLAIAQDKQEKTGLAVSSYKNALLQTDLSSKAKAYINQRLTYLDQK